MKPVSADQLLVLLEKAPEFPLPPLVLLEAKRWAPQDLATIRLRPRWLTNTALQGLSPFGLLAFQVGNGAHWERLEQGWHHWRGSDRDVSLAGPISEAGLVWLAAGQPCRSAEQRAQAVAWLTGQGLSVDALWNAAWQTSDTLHTQNALDLLWWEEVMGWVTGQPRSGLPPPSATVGAHFVIQMDNGQGPASFHPDFVGDMCDGKQGEIHPLPTWVATHADPDRALTWIGQMLKRKRKAAPGLDEAALIALKRGADPKLHGRASTLLPQAFAWVRAKNAGTLSMAGRTARPRMRS